MVVWRWLADPDRVRQWNEKFVEHTAPPFESLRLGSIYWTKYRMSKESHVQAEIVEWVPGSVVEVRYFGGDMGRDGWARERAEIHPFGDGCSVVRTVSFHDPRIPLPVRWLISWLMRGKTRPKGEYVDEIRRLAEAEVRGGV